MSFPGPGETQGAPTVILTIDEWIGILEGRIEDFKEAVSLVQDSDKAMLEKRIKHLWGAYGALHNVIHNIVAAKSEIA